MRRLTAFVVLSAFAWNSIGSALAADQDFPYDREFVLDARPMNGSKRLPGLDVSANGTATLDLWCNSGPGQAVVAAETITIILGPMSKRQCATERMQGDEDLLAALAEVTTWRLEGEVLLLLGPRTLRYRLMTN